MAQHFVVHNENPQARLIKQCAEIIAEGGVAVIPTDSSYALVCALGQGEALNQIRQIKQIDDDHLFTVLCQSLNVLGQYARVDNTAYRLLKQALPGPYTFILDGSKEMPRRVLHPKRKTIGLRVPNHVICQSLLAECAAPLLSTSLAVPQQTVEITTGEEALNYLAKQVDVVLDGGSCPINETTIVDLTEDTPMIVRQGQGSLAAIGLVTEEN